jgi:hypothetical protein
LIVHKPFFTASTGIKTKWDGDVIDASLKTA